MIKVTSFCKECGHQLGKIGDTNIFGCPACGVECTKEDEITLVENTDTGIRYLEKETLNKE